MAGSVAFLFGISHLLAGAGAYDAQDTATKYAPELGMQTVPSLNITYTEVGRESRRRLCRIWGERACGLSPAQMARPLHLTRLPPAKLKNATEAAVSAQIVVTSALCCLWSRSPCVGAAGALSSALCPLECCL